MAGGAIGVIYRTPELGPAEKAALDAIDGQRRALRFRTAEPRRWLGTVRRVLAARAVQGSNSIEGIHVSVEDAIAVAEGEETTDPRSLDSKAVAGYQRAMTYVVNLAGDQHFRFSADILRSLHFMMTEYELDAWPGRWRPGPIWVRDEASGDEVYAAPEAEDVPALIDALVASLEEASEAPPLVRAAMAHLNLVMIHPFRDGNGRMSRCLQTLVLAREKILTPDLCSIEEYLGRNTQRYYDVLAEVGQGSWKPGGDARAWIRFCLEAHYVQAASVIRRLDESGRIWSEIERLRDDAGLGERTIAALFDAAIGLQVRNAAYRSQLRGWDEQISNQTASADLRAMVAAGLLVQRGKNRGAYYVAADRLRAVRTAARKERTPIDTSGLFAPDRSVSTIR
ncbi:Fic family protein [Pseudonocardia tropica]|uniref:Fic family protein n=1 Tax=Pseudonocardia tropica TaxID=681289 RepID=A0ABV1JSI4_9PSEU|nr:Fic family protein [Pseudonocardia alni]